MKFNRRLALVICAALIGLGCTFLFPQIGYCSVESSLAAIQGKLLTTILPAAAILGLLFAGFSFVAGSPNAKMHLTLAIIGAGVGFAAPSIVAFIRGLVN